MRTELHQGWVFKSARGVTWYPAVVPGVVHTDLMSNGIIDDPFVRMNERACQWVDKEDWEYKTTFDLPDSVSGRQHLRLVFKGLDTYADVFLNGEKVLAANNMFRSWSIDCTGKLKNRGNLLRVYLHSPAKVDLPKYDALPYHYPASNDQSENGGLLEKKISVFARKAGYHYGWDWGPRLVTSGIWRPVLLEAWDSARLEEVQIFQDSVSSLAAVLRVVAQVSSTGSQTGVISFGDSTREYAAANVSLSPGLNTVTLRCTLPQPSLWWPNGLGEQHLYGFTTSLKLAGTVVDEKLTRTGIRSLRLVRRTPDGKPAFYFEVNGAPVFMKGANYIPCDNFLPRVTRQRYERVVLDARDANMNMLRVWGGGIYENDEFYEYCDAYGILVWHDFMFACSMYPADSEMLENIRQEAIENVKRIRSHPCLALWCGNNEIHTAWFNWGWKRDLEKQSKQQADRVWRDYEAVFHQTLPAVVQQEDPGTAYWKSSPFEEAGSADMHFWNVWHGEAPIDDYAKEIPQFMSEYGFQSFPEYSSVRRFAPEERDHDIFSEVMLLHQRNPRGNQLIKSYMARDYREPKDFRSFLYMSHLLQADAVRIGEEAHRRNRPRCMGSLFWQLNDCWPVASWSSTDYYGRWKALQYYTRRAFAEVLVSPYEVNGTLQVHLVSDRRSAFQGDLAIRVLDFRGRTLSALDRKVTVPGNASTLVLARPVEELLQGAPRTGVVVYAGIRENGTLLSSNTWYPARAKELDLPQASLVRSIREVEGGFELTLESDGLLRGLYLETLEGGSVFSDNYFDLIPGLPVTVKVRTALPEAEFEEQLKAVSLRDAYTVDASSRE